jgi:hypothetical protein
MIKVIETNLSINNDNIIIDHQSRVIEIESWDSYTNEFAENISIIKNSCIGSLHGATIPRSATIENLTYDDKHLMCDIINYANMKSKKLAYLV